LRVGTFFDDVVEWPEASLLEELNRRHHSRERYEGKKIATECAKRPPSGFADQCPGVLSLGHDSVLCWTLCWTLC